MTFGVNSTLVQAHTNKYAETFPSAVGEILHNIYVDDYLTGANADNSALKLQQEMSEIMMAQGST